MMSFTSRFMSAESSMVVERHGDIAGDVSSCEFGGHVLRH